MRLANFNFRFLFNSILSERFELLFRHVNRLVLVLLIWFFWLLILSTILSTIVIIVIFNFLAIVRIEVLFFRIKLFNNLHKHIFQRTVGNSNIRKSKLFFNRIHCLKQRRYFERRWYFQNQIPIEMLEQVSSRELFLHELNNLSTHFVQLVCFRYLMLNETTDRLSDSCLLVEPLLLLNAKMKGFSTDQLSLLFDCVYDHVVTLSVSFLQFYWGLDRSKHTTCDNSNSVA